MYKQQNRALYISAPKDINLTYIQEKLRHPFFFSTNSPSHSSLVPSFLVGADAVLARVRVRAVVVVAARGTQAVSLPGAGGSRSAAGGTADAAVAGEVVGAVVVGAARSTGAVAGPGAAASRGRRRRSGAAGDASLDRLLEVAVLDGELSLPEHDAANVGEVESRDALVGRQQAAGGDVALVAVGTAGQSADEEGGVADALAPVLDGVVEAGLGNVAVAVVVELDPDVVGQLADVEGFRGVGERALGSSSQVVLLAGVLGEVGLEALGHGQVASGVAGLVVYHKLVLAEAKLLESSHASVFTHRDQHRPA